VSRRSRPTRKSGGRERAKPPEDAPDLLLDREEDERQNVLRSLDLLDSPAEERFDRICREVREVLGAPASYISLLDRDRQWFKSTVGMGEVKETPRDGTFCDYAIRRSRPTVVLDATQDPLFSMSPYVTEGPKVRFYAGVPLWVEGQRVGTLCALDFEARQDISAEQLEQLCDLAARAQNELALPSHGPSSVTTAAFLVAGLAEVMSFVSGLSAAEASGLLERYVVVFSDVVERWGGRVESAGGVELQAAFLDPESLGDQATRGAGCAIDLVRELAGLRDMYPDEERLPELSLGLHQSVSLMGSVSTSAELGPLFGWGADTARRIARLAAPGQILISEQLHTSLGAAGSTDGSLTLRLPDQPTLMTLHRLVAVGDFGLEVGTEG
jgi:class 3 adenylate cyclase